MHADTFSNFSYMQMETNCAHTRIGTHAAGASGQAGPMVRVAGAYCIYWKPI
jgi:hypothetical protein